MIDHSSCAHERTPAARRACRAARASGDAAQTVSVARERADGPQTKRVRASRKKLRGRNRGELTAEEVLEVGSDGPSLRTDAMNYVNYTNLQVIQHIQPANRQAYIDKARATDNIVRLAGNWFTVEAFELVHNHLVSKSL